MKIKTKYSIFLFILLPLFLLAGCKADEEEQCVQWKYDEEWQKIANSSSCTAEQRGEAYLALGGFDYFNLIKYKDDSFIKILGLSKNNWQTKETNFRAAANVVEPVYQNGSGIAKTIYLLGTFAGAFTHLAGKLDNGADSSPDVTADAFDGIIAKEEIDEFVKVEIKDTSNDLSEMVPLNLYQLKSGTEYYLWDSSAEKLYTDNSADGIMDSSPTEISDGSLLLSIQSNASNIYQINQLNNIQNPLSDDNTADNTGDSAPEKIKSFASQLASDLSKMKNSLTALDLEETSNLTDEITKFQNKLDNGGKCKSFDLGSALNFVNMIVAKTRKEQLITGSYASENLLGLSDFTNDATSDKLTKPSIIITRKIPPVVGVDVTIDLMENISDFGIKMRFKDSGNNPQAYWKGSTIESAMDLISELTSDEVKAGDNKIALTEIACTSELISEKD